jgi:PASTA domain
MRILVISANGAEASLPAIKSALDYVGTPYDVFVGTQSAAGLTADMLSTACAGAPDQARALYQGVILTTESALSEGEFATLAEYERRFGIRQVTWYTWPTPRDGFNWYSKVTPWNGAPVTAQLTAAGKAVFPYIRTGEGSSPIVIQYAQTFHATPIDTATTVPLLTDDSGNALAAIHTYSDGRVSLVMTFDHSPWLLHSMLLSYGVINWVTDGLFIGERHTYINAQIDDLFIDDQQWLASTSCGTDVDHTNATHRMDGADLTAVTNWQNTRRQQPLTRDLKITMAFNGLGATPEYDYRVVGSNDSLIGGAKAGPRPDTLTSAAVQQQHNYFWSSHTFTHANLDAISEVEAASEISLNNAVATQLGLQDYTTQFMVQPDVSGLGNAAFLRAAYNNGIRYLVSNTSKPGQDNPTPNTGYWNAVDPRIFVIPRRANNLFFNVASPADWVKEYNCIYGPNGVAPYFPSDRTYAQILDFVSNELTMHLMRGELDPWMFHQTNLDAYDGTRTLLGDLLDVTFQKYGSYMTFPIISPSIDTIGQRMKDRTLMRTQGISGTIQPGVGIVLKSPNTLTVPVTGIKNGAELYNGQYISWVPLNANVEVTVPFVAPLSAEKSSSSSGSGTRTATVSTSQPDALLLAFVGAGGPSDSRQEARVTGAGLTWSLVRRVNAQRGTAEVWAAIAPGKLSNAAVTSTLRYSAHQSLTVVPFGGSAGVGASAGRSAEEGAPIVPLTTTKANSLVYGVGDDPRRATRRTLGPNQVMIHEFLNISSEDTYWVQALMAPVPGASTTVYLNDTAPTRDPWNFAAIEIVPSPKLTLVPNVVSKSRTAALTDITNASLRLGTETNAFSTVVPAGTVMNQGPAAGASVMSGTSVNIVVSAGAPIAVPDVANMTEANATAAITSLGLKIAPVSAYSATVPPGYVISQSPSAGTNLAAGAVVTINVSASGPVADKTVSSGGSGTRRVTVSATAGQLLMAFAAADGPRDSSQSLSVSGGGITWTRVARANSQRGTAEIWRARAAATGTLTVTSTQNRSGYPSSLTVVTFNGATGTGNARTASRWSGAPTVSITTTTSNSLVYGVGNDPSAAIARTLGPGQMMIHERLDMDGRDTFWVQARSGNVPTPGTTVTVNDTAPSSDRWNLAAVEIVR